MFKNRVRTAALAGAIAVATGISGMAVPAFAVETNTQQDEFNIGDGSASAPVVPENITEGTLRTQTEATATYLDGFQNATGLRDIIEDYINLGTDGFDPSEQAAESAFQEARERATTELDIASQNVQDARNSVGFALEVDQQADADWQALVAALQTAANELNPLITAVNAAEDSIDVAPFGTPLDTLASPVTTENAVSVYRALLALQTRVDLQVETAGDWNIDQNSEQRINRNHASALEALQDAIGPRADSVREAYETAVDSNFEAQKSDVLVRQLYLERAKAQVNTLRIVQATFAVAERYLELYQDDVLVGDGVLSTEYREVLGNLATGLAQNLEWLNAADDAAEAGFLVWETDLANNDDGDYQIFVEKLDFATESYAKVLWNGAVWQEALKRVELIDQGIIDQVAADEAQAEAERIAAEEAARAAKEQADALKDIRDALAENPGNGNGTPPANGGNEGSIEGSSENAGLFGIIAAIGGVVALIAAAFPFIQNFLR